MRKHIHIIVMTVLLSMGVLIGFLFTLAMETELPMYIEVVSDGSVEEIRCWRDGVSKANYVFLPSYANADETRIRLKTSTGMKIGETAVEDGMTISSLEWNKPYPLMYCKLGKEYQETISFLRSANVAAMYIDVESGNMEHIHSDKENKEAGRIRVYATDGTLNHRGDLEAIGGRGNHSWDAFEKKPYSLTLSRESDFLGMGKAQRWILLANASDPSNLRNKLVYDFAQSSGLKYSPDSAWVDLYLNGRYVGLYLLSERNEVHPERVDIDEGFLVSQEIADRLSQQEKTHIITYAGTALQVRHPENISSRALARVNDLFQSVENAMFAADGIDPVTNKALPELMDMDSWARKHLIEEVFGNMDAGMVSQYYYYDAKADLVFAGPVWDYDHAIGSDTDFSWSIPNPDAFVVTRAFTSAAWSKLLYQNDAFYAKMLEIYEADFLPLLGDLLESKIGEYKGLLHSASVMNAVRWNQSDAEASIEQIREYLTGHIRFLSDAWLNNQPYYQVAFFCDVGNNYFYSVRPNECLSKLPELNEAQKEGFLGWYYVGTDELFDPDAPICENTLVHAVWANEETEQEDFAAASERAEMATVLTTIAVFSLLGAALMFAEIKRARNGA